MSSTPITYFTHNFGFDKKIFDSLEELKDTRVVAFYSKGGRQVVAAFQHNTLPIYGVQFHPEKILFESNHVVNKNLTRESSIAAQELSRIMFNAALESKNRFLDQSKIAKLKFTKYRRHNTKSVFNSIFLFKTHNFVSRNNNNSAPVCVAPLV